MAQTESSQGASSRSNPSGSIWKSISAVLFLIAVGAIGYIAYNQPGGGVGKVSSQTAADGVIAFVNEVYASQVGEATFKSVVEENGIYKITVDVTTAEGPVEQIVYASLDGKLFIPQAVDMEQLLGEYRSFLEQQQQPGGQVDIQPAPEGQGDIQVLPEGAAQ